MPPSSIRDFIIIGSGPAGAAAALQLSREDVLLLDVGLDAPAVPSDFSGSLTDLRQTGQDLFPHLIGDDFAGMHNLFTPSKRNFKLKAPYTRYLVDAVDSLTPIQRDAFYGDISLAKGGLANAWGAVCCRFSDHDLRDFPVSYAELEPYYDQLTAHIGISGANDDLENWLLHDTALQEPVQLSRMAQTLLGGYEKRRTFYQQRGLYIGRSRIAVLSHELNERSPYAHDNMEFFRTQLPAVYTPAYTIESLRAKGTLDYRAGFLVESFKDCGDYVDVQARDLRDQTMHSFACRNLLLGAGALNSARLVLRSAHDFESRLPVLDNPMSIFPLFNIAMLGAPDDPYSSSLAQLHFVYTQAQQHGTPTADNVLCSFYGMKGPLRTDIFTGQPLPQSAGRLFVKHTLSCFGTVLCFYPARPQPANHIRLDPEKGLAIHFEPVAYGQVERAMMWLFARMGFLSLPMLIAGPSAGSGLHYAGCLPMRAQPGDYQCDSRGRLHNRVFCIDGALFPSLPAKNYSLTIMANAMRISHALQKERS